MQRNFPRTPGRWRITCGPRLYHEINNFYTATVYQKGAEVVRMLKRLIGPETFRAGMDLYFDRFDGHAATVEDFIGCFEKVSGRDLGQFMRWYSQAGTPKITVRSAYDPSARTYRLDIAQSLAPTPGQAVKAPMTMPLALGLVGANGGDLPLASSDASADELASGVFELKDAERSIVFRDVPQRPTLSFLRGFSTPARVDDDLTEEDLIVLSRHDSDNFNRWQSLQSLATRVLLRGVKAIRAGRPPERDGGLASAFGALIEDASLGRIDHAFAALAMALPTEADLAREIGEDVDPDAIHVARMGLRGALGRAHGGALAALHAGLAGSSPFSPDAAAAGRRALRNVALSLFVDGDVIEGLELAHRQFAEADNMTERLGALTAIAFKPDDQRQHALEAFERRYATEPLILDKWFALQAQIPERETLERMRQAYEPPRILARQSQPRASVDRLLHRQPDAVQPRRRRGLCAARGGGHLSRSEQSADRRAAPDRNAVVALARGGPPGSGGGDAEAHRRHPVAFAGRPRHRDPQPGLRPRPSSIARRETGVLPDTPWGGAGEGCARSARCASGRFLIRSASPTTFSQREKGKGAPLSADCTFPHRRPSATFFHP